MGRSTFVVSVKQHIHQFTLQQAIRNPNKPFLPIAQPSEVFGIPHLYSGLERKLRRLGKTKAGSTEWRNTIQSYTQKGIKQNEIDCFVLNPETTWAMQHAEQFTAVELAELCNFKDLRLSIIAVHKNANQQLKFVSPPDKKLPSTKKQPKIKPQTNQTRQITHFDPVLGYRLEKVIHQTLWGEETNWQAVTHSGHIIQNALNLSIVDTDNIAAKLAASHAAQRFPKKFAYGSYRSWAWTGGANYREWLITLPYYPQSYLSGHFKVRNVLAHIRCDIREGEHGERILMLQELQSDWAQRTRRAAVNGTRHRPDETPPPFMKEWQSLVMKLVLLHAANEGLDAVAWTRGAHQAFRYKNISHANLNELYDRTLPREVNRLLKPYGASCETLGVYVPANFAITQTEHGYEVFSKEDNELLGTAPSLAAASEFVPDGGHEILYQVHGVKLTSVVRAAILSNGFAAWG
ncbi:MAG: hypothetical protein IPQ12_09135 [Polaromonas sp.]|nr:hypothetical protein [Polaromonas sp.]